MATNTELREDDVVQPVAGILDVLDNYAFVRTSGYLAGPHDVYVSMNMVRKNGLRRGDAVTGAVRVPKEGEQPNQRQKFNPLVRLDSVNGGPVEDAKKRPDFTKMTPLYPNQRLRLETTPDRLTTRVIDLIMPIGKGQRALIVSPPKAGKTTILQDIANAITKNNPECHLMVVLVDERPEEVTDMTRSVKGEVIASTFDRPPSDHTAVAELAIERAKRLVEQGKDVVVLLDSITRLGRAYNNASPASGRILSGGVDSTALYPPKRFLGAARNIEEGGSLTIIATAMVETGSTGDTVIFEEFKGTGNAELKLDRKISERRVFPAVDVNPSGTRKDELLLSPDEFGIVHKLRRVLSGLDSHQAIDLLMSQLRKTKTNYEFLVQVSKTTPGAHGQRLARLASPAVAETLQQLLRERLDQDTPAVKYGDRAWTWREHLADADQHRRRADRHRRSGPARCTSARCWATPPRCSPPWRRPRSADMCCAESTTPAAATRWPGISCGPTARSCSPTPHTTSCSTVSNCPVSRWSTCPASRGRRSSRGAGALIPYREVAPTDTFMMIFTSGTSGEPKAVQITHLVVLFAGLSLIERFEVDASDVCYLSMPLFHSNALLAGWSVAVGAGTAMVPATFSASGLLPDLRRYGATYMNYVGKPLAYVLATPEQAR